MSETGSGSDVVSMKTTAVQDGEHFVLNGSKFWITNAQEADIFLVRNYIIINSYDFLELKY